jgi:hypothetical protein
VVLEEFIDLANRNSTNRQNELQRQAIVRLDGDREGFGRRFAAAARSLVEEISEVVIPLGDTHPSKDHQGRIQIVGRAFNLNSYYSRIGNLLNQTITPQIASGMTELGSGSNLSTEDRLRILGLFPQVDLTLRFQVVQTSKVIDLEMTGQEVARARSPSRRDEDQGHSNPSRASSLARYNPTDNTLRLTLNSQLRNLSFRTPIGVWIAWERATTLSPQK